MHGPDIPIPDDVAVILQAEMPWKMPILIGWRARMIRYLHAVLNNDNIVDYGHPRVLLSDGPVAARSPEDDVVSSDLLTYG